jgi:predicted RNA binding protein YcfA (HicA-like mRNA interferase family)
MAGGTEVTALAGKGQQILMIAVVTFHPGETIMQDTAIKILKNDLLDM